MACEGPVRPTARKARPDEAGEALGSGVPEYRDISRGEVQIGLKGWLKGLVVAEVTAVPILILVVKTEPFSLIPIIIMSAILGSLVGSLGEKYAK